MSSTTVRTRLFNEVRFSFESFVEGDDDEEGTLSFDANEINREIAFRVSSVQCMEWRYIQDGTEDGLADVACGARLIKVVRRFDEEDRAEWVSVSQDSTREMGWSSSAGPDVESAFELLV